jgi:hypothetical protein
MLEPLLVWEGGWDPEGAQVKWSTIEADISFQVVPAPGSLLLPACILIGAARRSR